MNPLNIHIDACRYRAMIGVGGIGTGVFFAVEGNHTVGREESRSGRFIDRRDYCKLHIVSHYVKALMGPDFRVFPVGKVGADDPGKRLFGEMAEAGFDLEYVEKTEEVPTLFSFCFIYPDGSGGNFTTDDSASARVTPDFVAKSEGFFCQHRGLGIALAVPEVPLDARLALLEFGTRYGFLRAASFSSREMDDVLNGGVLGMIDFLALNIDEAARTLQVRGLKAGSSGADTAIVVEASVAVLASLNPKVSVSITAGGRGSWVWDGKRITHLPAPPVEVVSTAGAGDAFLAGMIAGVNAGLALAEAQELATLIASLSVTSPHTIHKGIDRVSLREFDRKTGVIHSEQAARLLMP